MVLEKGFKVQQYINNCIIHYIYILLNLSGKGYGTYIIGKVFRSDKELEFAKIIWFYYTNTRLHSLWLY